MIRLTLLALTAVLLVAPAFGQEPEDFEVPPEQEFEEFLEPQTEEATAGGACPACPPSGLELAPVGTTERLWSLLDRLQTPVPEAIPTQEGETMGSAFLSGFVLPLLVVALVLGALYGVYRFGRHGERGGSATTPSLPSWFSAMGEDGTVRHPLKVEYKPGHLKRLVVDETHVKGTWARDDAAP